MKMIMRSRLNLGGSARQGGLSMAWNVIESAAFLRDLEEIGPEGYDWDERREAIRFFLQADPEHVGYATQDASMRIYIQDGPEGARGLKVFFEIEDQTVTILRGRGYATNSDD